MKYLNEYRGREAILNLAKKIRALTTKPWTIMEVCGGQTHSIVKYGLQELLPKNLELVHGPGCPVCVTSLETIDKAIEIASNKSVILCSFGDMLRVPGSEKDLLKVKSQGGDIRIVYSPLDAVKIARENPKKEVVFLAVGFETTAPANAMAVFMANQTNIKNFSILVSHFLVPPAIEAVCSSPKSRIQGFLAAGHVCTVMGFHEYIPLAEKYRVPIVVTGFEPLDIMDGIHMCVSQLEQGRFEVDNQYARSVKEQGNPTAQLMIQKVFNLTEQNWRGLGELSKSGLQLTPEFHKYDAEKKFQFNSAKSCIENGCISGEIMQGHKKPMQCIHFGTTCRPETPLGAPMVSSEGPCAAYYRYRRPHAK